MGSNPFSPIYNHVVAYNIHEVKINYDRYPYAPSEKIAEHIASRLKENPIKFDGKVWKVRSIAMDFDSGILSLGLSLGRYSQYRYTNLDPELRTKVSDSRQWCTVVALGALVLSSDGKIAFTRRPMDAHLSPGRIDMPCGHPTSLTPTQESLPAAIKLIVKKEIGEVNVLGMTPLVLIFEEPKSAYDLIYEVRVEETGQQLLDMGMAKTTIDSSSASVADFLNAEDNVSRPVHLALAYYGRKEFGEEWFLKFCRDRN